MTYYILKGWHYSINGLLRYFVKQSNTAIVTFDKSCWYDTKVYGDHINKLFGKSQYSNPHKHSYRIGWKPSKIENYIELYIYNYQNGIRNISKLGKDVNVNESCTIGLTPHTSLKLPYKLGFYFGGKPTAPHNMKVKIEFK